MKHLMLVIMSLLMITSPLFAEKWKHDKRPQQGQFFDPEDKEIFALMKDKHQDIKAEMDLMMKERQKLGELLKDPNSSEEDIRKQSALINEQMIKVNNKRTDDILSLRKQLPPEKFKKLIDRMEERHSEMREKFKDRSGFSNQGRQKE